MFLRLLVGIRFQVLFHSPYRGAFHLSLTVLVHYRSISSTQPQIVVDLSSDRISRAPPYSLTIKLSTRTGLSPSMMCLPRHFRFLSNRKLAGPISLATTFGVSVDFLSLSYLDVSVRSVRFITLSFQIMMTLRPGFPIRIPQDQCLFITPLSFSQCITSFFASDCQGIHQMPLPIA